MRIDLFINGSRMQDHVKAGYYSLVGTIGLWVLRRNGIALDPSVSRAHLGYLLLTGKGSDPNTIKAKVKHFIAYFSQIQ